MALIKSRSRVSHPLPTAPRFFWRTGTVDEAWKTRAALEAVSADGVRTLGILRSEHRPNQSPRATSETDLRRHGTPIPLDRWHSADGVIHALSTATIPRQSSRGGQRVGNPLDGLGRWPLPATHDAARRVLYLVRLQSSHDGQPVGRNIAPIKTRPEVADVRRTGGLATIEHRPFSSRGVAFPTLRPPRLGFSGGPAPWTKRGKRAALVVSVRWWAAFGRTGQDRLV